MMFLSFLNIWEQFICFPNTSDMWQVSELISSLFGQPAFLPISEGLVHADS